MSDWCISITHILPPLERSCSPITWGYGDELPYVDGPAHAFHLQNWVVPENTRTPTTGGVLEFRMHGGFFGLEFQMNRGGLLGLDFQKHEGVSSPGILNGGRRGLKTLIY